MLLVLVLIINILIFAAFIFLKKIIRVFLIFIYIRYS